MHKLAIMEVGIYPGGYEFEGEAATCSQVKDPTKVVTGNEEIAYIVVMLLLMQLLSHQHSSSRTFLAIHVQMVPLSISCPSVCD